MTDLDFEREERGLALEERRFVLSEKKEHLRSVKLQNENEETRQSTQEGLEYINGHMWPNAFRTLGDYFVIKDVAKSFNQSLSSVANIIFVDQSGRIGFPARFYIVEFNKLPEWDSLDWEVSEVDGKTFVQAFSKKGQTAYASQKIDREWVEKQKLLVKDEQWDTNFLQMAKYRTASMFFKTYAPNVLGGNNITEDMLEAKEYVDKPVTQAKEEHISSVMDGYIIEDEDRFESEETQIIELDA